jgi:hypothetical protein
MEALVQGVDELVAVGEVDVKRALCDPRVGDDTVDAEARETVFVGHSHARIEKRVACARAGDGNSAPRHAAPA